LPKKPKLALVGAQTLIGREIRELAGDYEVFAMDTAPAEGQTLVRRGDDEDIEIMPPMDAKRIASADIVMLAGDSASAEMALKMGARRIIDLNGSLDGKVFAAVRAPMAEAGASKAAALSEVAHPAAVSLALFAKGLRSKPVRIVATVMLPASEYGTAGITELQQQTVSLLSFKQLPKKVFDAQAAYALLAELGDDAPAKLAATAARVEKHLDKLLDGIAVSTTVVQAPVFHGLSVSVWVEFEGEADLDGILEGEHLDLHGADLEPPNNVGIAGQDGVAVKWIRRDGRAKNAAWFWLAADNHRLTARNALALAAEGKS
jgi:aspartate-semialdehyde dehydrogenase